MPIHAPITVTAPTTAVTGLLTISEAARRVARVIGGQNDNDVLDEAEDAILAAIEDLNLAWDWEFLRKTYSITAVADTADYALPTDLRAVYSLRDSNGTPLRPFSQRDYDRVAAQQSTGTPYGYNLFPSSTVEALDPQHTQINLRLIPTPSSGDTLTLKYYRRTVMYTSIGTIDLPRQYQHWVIYAAKAMVLADHGGESDRAAFWMRKAERMLQLMKFSDLDQMTDQTPGFSPDDYSLPDLSHPRTALFLTDGF